MAVVMIYAARLTYLHVFDTKLKLEGARNSKGDIVLQPPRGLIYAADSTLLVSNQPAYRINLTYLDFELKDTAAFCKTFDITPKELKKKLDDAYSVRIFEPKRVLKEFMSVDEFAAIADKLHNYPGISYEAFTIRHYNTANMADVLGYIREVNTDDIQRSEGYYQQRDLIGKSGVEMAYEEYLRGEKGIRYVMRNARRKIVGSLAGGRFDTLPNAGQNLMLSIRPKLQAYAERLMQGKKGAVVVIEPATGEILTMVAAPSYDPNLLSGRNSDIARNYTRLLRDEHKPLYNRVLQAPYPPGSTFKTAMAMVGLQMGALDTLSSRYSCIKSIVGCHSHSSPLSLGPAIQTSCNPYFVQSFWSMVRKPELEDSRQALDLWQQHMYNLGLGRKLGVDLAYESPGRIPGTDYYDARFDNHRWKIGNIQSIGIGQGEVGVTPLQLANLAAIIANRGWYYTPHIVKSIGNSGQPLPEYQVRHQSGIDSIYVDFVARAMRNVVIAGTARSAHIPDIAICGKTGTAQNPHGEDHSVFMAFAPLHQPQIAVSVYVENAGYGGSWAAPIASLIVEMYLKGEISTYRKYWENRVLSKSFIEPQTP